MFEPTIVDSTVDLSVNVPSISKVLDTIKLVLVLAVAAYEALVTLPNKKDAVEALFAQLDVPNNEPVNPNVDVVEPVTIKLPVINALPVNGNPAPLPPPPPFIAYEAVTAYEAVPCKLPVNEVAVTEPDTSIDPVTVG